MNGIVLINKPTGVSSFSVCSMVKRTLSVKKAGHAGTLDPLATGVLPVLLGSATRIADLLPCNEKRYRAELMLGMTTDTLDCEGEVLTDQPVEVTRERLEQALRSFQGEIMQLPPMYSALKRGGVPLYTLARQGIEVQRSPRPITIYSIALLEYDEQEARAVIDVRCSKGTYIRSLIDDIGQQLGCGAYMSALCRTASSGFTLDECVSIDELRADALITPEQALGGYDAVTVTPAQVKRFANGGALDITRLRQPVQDGGCYRVYGEDGGFAGLGIVQDGSLAVRWIMK